MPALHKRGMKFVYLERVLIVNHYCHFKKRTLPGRNNGGVSVKSNAYIWCFYVLNTAIYGEWESPGSTLLPYRPV
jgi:hypothetical protein